MSALGDSQGEGAPGQAHPLATLPLPGSEAVPMAAFPGALYSASSQLVPKRQKEVTVVASEIDPWKKCCVVLRLQASRQWDGEGRPSGNSASTPRVTAAICRWLLHGHPLMYVKK